MEIQITQIEIAFQNSNSRSSESCAYLNAHALQFRLKSNTKGSLSSIQFNMLICVAKNMTSFHPKGEKNSVYNIH